ncbi:cadmium resistance transporter [Aphanothece sacrum]|uniref:Cadmium resistance transporter n=1 Tax=Aphanothece sacrum FPU1 TaxID=1920663 RepID=A0A401IM27_APHSA|nr:cadmium resistance transporter [Aphanothece sacrum]GBF82314.1 cadmium resistance transporter [Aphanothece sacrum FPU1]GBF84214.1 cadmium resistance transporter [Aphanothece sacrum FPU3]
MTTFLSIVLTGIFSFIATNLDDLLILTLFFSQKEHKSQVYSIVIGQYLGFTIIILASLPGFLGGLMIPKEWIGFLGLVPLIIGIKSLFNQEDNNDDIKIKLTQPVFNGEQKSNSWIRYFRRYLNSTVLYVASVTIANGGDNISIYLSLFSQKNLLDLTIILLIFYFLVGVWCFLAYWLVSHQIIAKIFLKYGRIITPFVLISLGIFILIDGF